MPSEASSFSRTLLPDYSKCVINLGGTASLGRYRGGDRHSQGGRGTAILGVVLVLLINVVPPFPLAESGPDSANAKGGVSIGRSQEAAFTMSDKLAN